MRETTAPCDPSFTFAMLIFDSMHDRKRLTTRRSVLLCAGLLPVCGRAAGLEQVDLFRQGDGGVHTYRIPALLETRRGDLLAVADARHDGSGDLPGRISLVMRRSRDGGRTWSAVRTLRAVPEGGVGDASLLLDRKSGRIWCFHAFGPPGVGFATAESRRLQAHAISSDDDGETWSAPVDLTPQIQDPAWQAMFVTSGTHFETSRGRFLAPLVVRDGDGVVSARNAYSDDRGRTWKVGKAIGAGTDESKAVELADGIVLQNLRNGKTRAVARSRDGGVTFDAVAHDEALVDPGCNAGLARRRDLLVFTNAAAPQRRNLTVKISADGGRSWSPGRTLHAGPAAYSTVIPLRDGTLGVLYECGEQSSTERIVFARFDAAWARAQP